MNKDVYLTFNELYLITITKIILRNVNFFLWYTNAWKKI